MASDAMSTPKPLPPSMSSGSPSKSPVSASLISALRKRRAMPASGSPGVEKSATGTFAGPTSPGAPGAEKAGVVSHHAQVVRHLENGMKGSRRSAKVHMKMALHHAKQLAAAPKDAQL